MVLLSEVGLLRRSFDSLFSEEGLNISEYSVGRARRSFAQKLLGDGQEAQGDIPSPLSKQRGALFMSRSMHYFIPGGDVWLRYRTSTGRG